MTPKEQVEAWATTHNVTMDAVFVPWSKSRHRGERQTLNWVVTLNKEGRPFWTGDYSAGIAYCPGYRQRETAESRRVVAWEVEHGKKGWYAANSDYVMPATDRRPLLPELASVLASLALEANTLNYPTFEDWSEDFGYDADSRKGEAAYQACLKTALQLRAGLGEEALTELVMRAAEY